MRNKIGYQFDIDGLRTIVIEVINGFKENLFELLNKKGN